MGSFMQKISENRALSASLFVLFLYLVPFLVLGQDIPVLVADTIDSNLVWSKVLVESGQLFGGLDSTIPNVMNGLPRSSYGSELNLIVFSALIPFPFAVYLLHIFLIHIIAFAGMYLLLKRHFLAEEKYAGLVAGIALCFALIPLWPLGGISLAGLPLALYCFLNVRSGHSRKLDWLVLALIPFYSEFTLSFVFFLFAMALFWLFDLTRRKKTNWKFLIAIIFMGLIFLIVEYRLVFTMFFNPNFVSHRIEFEGYPNNFVMILGRSARTFIYGNNSLFGMSLHYYFVFVATAMALAVIFIRKQGKLLERLGQSLIVKLLAVILAISIFAEFFKGWDVLEPLKDKVTLLRTFGFNRLTFLFPLLWPIVFALSLKTIFDRLKYGRQIAFALIILQAAFLFSYSSDSVQPGGLGLVLSQGITFNEFYSVELFQEIDNFIGVNKSDYRIVSIGIHPGISQYNGFYTLDSYQHNYFLEYKHRFRAVIEKELEKSPNHLKRYFDGWGNRCYLYPAELEGNTMQTKDIAGKLENLELNTQALKELGADYVFSALEIENTEENSLTLLHTFERDDSPWRIWLYKVK